MKKLVEEIEGEGLESLIGEYVLLKCMNYFYAGKLIGVNTHDVLLSEAKVVYNIGNINTPGFEQAEKFPNNWYVRISAIESYGLYV